MEIRSEFKVSVYSGIISQEAPAAIIIYAHKKSNPRAPPAEPKEAWSIDYLPNNAPTTSTHGINDGIASQRDDFGVH